MNARNRVFISYASQDVDIATRTVKCFEPKYKGMIWFDEKEIVWGDNVIQEINVGLRDTLMGIMILSDNFFQRNMPQLELSAMVSLMNAVQFRILPLLHGISHNDLISRYPLLSPIRYERADEDCVSLASKFEKALNKTRQLINVSVETLFRPAPTSNVNIDDNVEDVDPTKLKSIYNDLTGGGRANRRSAAITTLRRYSEKRRLWNQDISWDIISYLINSQDNSDIKDGLYVLEYMIRTSAKIGDIDHQKVKELIRERFGSQLVKLSYPTVDRRVSFDSFVILKEITKEDTLSKYAIEALQAAMAKVENDNDYTRYIQTLVSYFEGTSKETIQRLCDVMYDLTLREGRMGERARNLYEHFIECGLE